MTDRRQILAQFAAAFAGVLLPLPAGVPPLSIPVSPPAGRSRKTPRLAPAADRHA